MLLPGFATISESKNRNEALLSGKAQNPESNRQRGSKIPKAIDNGAAPPKNERSSAISLNFFRAPLTVEMLNLWKDFRKVVEFIDNNEKWLKKMSFLMKNSK